MDYPTGGAIEIKLCGRALNDIVEAAKTATEISKILGVGVNFTFRKKQFWCDPNTKLEKMISAIDGEFNSKVYY